MGKKDGKDRVYDEDGNLIKMKDERVIWIRKGVYCEVRKDGIWNKIFGGTMFPWGKGMLCRTNKRLVLIRDPIETVGVFLHSGGLHMPVTVSVRKRTKKSGVREYLQIGLREIEQWKKGLFNKHKVTVVDKDRNRYRVCLKMVP